MALTPFPFVVWYNTYCPVCRTGIDRQRNRLLRAVKAGTIEFRNINLEPDALAAHGADVEAVRRRLYGMDGTGRVYVGIDCAIEIWRRTPGEAWIARLLETSLLHPLSRWPMTASPTGFMLGTVARAIGSAGVHVGRSNPATTSSNALAVRVQAVGTNPARTPASHAASPARSSKTAATAA